MKTLTYHPAFEMFFMRASEVPSSWLQSYVDSMTSSVDEEHYEAACKALIEGHKEGKQMHEDSSDTEEYLYCIDYCIEGAIDYFTMKIQEKKRA